MKIDERRGFLYRDWGAPSAKAVLLLVHGLGAHSGRWEFLADYALTKQYASYAIELKGFGASSGLKGHIDSFSVYCADIERLREIIREEHGNKKVFLIGESMGALISLLMAAERPQFFDGLVCISPAFSSRIPFKALDYVKIFSSLLYNPRRQFTIPFHSGMCTRDTEYRKIMDADEREHRFATSKLLVLTLIAQIKSLIIKNRIAIPILFLTAGEDMLVDPGVTKSVFKGLRQSDKKLIDYPGMHHALSIEEGREKVFEDVLSWIGERV
jgi:acylglycerol lipase